MGNLALLLGALTAMLAMAVVLGFLLARRMASPLRRLVRELSNLTPDRLGDEQPPRIRDHMAQEAINRLWSIGRGLGARERELVAQNATLQRQRNQASAVIDLMAEFNKVMHLGAVLERLSRGLSRFFVGDAVAIWIRAAEGSQELVASVVESFPLRLLSTDPWVEHLLAGGSTSIRPPWLRDAIPWMAAPLLDAQGQTIGIVALTSRRRSAYTVEDRAFLRNVIGHAAMAIQNATIYQSVDRLSRVDPLTGLNNRREFDRRLGQELIRSQRLQQPLSLLMIDTDHFKKINDQLGHQEGDRVLRQLARLILLVPRLPEDEAFRIGGEEFAVLMTQNQKSEAIASADSLRRIVERTKFFREGAQLTISVGVATLPADGQTPAALIQAADRALYQAKSAGRNQVQAA
ncbi:MAG TPA: sensor domain-containing diguanylate cyclase [Candidatus Acidoferrum sp.]|nr:sensor domain-containing diguanylate cyclase [Candidatus Acidoferrum sp.]